MTKGAINYIITICKQYIDDVLRGWGLSKEEKELVAFEKEHMPYTKYSGNQSVDHVLFRKFLRLFDPEVVKQEAIEYLKEHIDESSDAVLSVFQRKVDTTLLTENKTVVGAINEIQETKAEIVELSLLEATVKSIDDKHSSSIELLQSNKAEKTQLDANVQELEAELVNLREKDSSLNKEIETLKNENEQLKSKIAEQQLLIYAAL